VAELIHNGNVVARFDGRMEYGPVPLATVPSCTTPASRK